MIRIVASTNRRAVEALLSPERIRDRATERRVEQIVGEVRREGDGALIRYARELDDLSGPLEVSIDEMRRMRPVPTDDIRGASSDRTDASAIRKQLVAAIEAALADLSPELRAAFLLREYHGLEYTEIARSLNIELGTVKSRLARARTLLRAL